MMTAMLTRDSHLLLSSGSYVDELSRAAASVDRSEQLFTKFVRYVNAVAAKQYPPAAKKKTVTRRLPRRRRQLRVTDAPRRTGALCAHEPGGTVTRKERFRK